MKILDKINTFKNWKDLKKETKVKIVKLSTYNNYTKETTLYLEDSKNPLIYLILSGYIISSKISSNGKEKYLYYLSNGDLVNQCAIDGKVTTTTSKAVRNTETISIHKDIFLNLMKEDFKLCSLVLNSLTLTIRKSQRQILNLGVYGISQRTVSKLLKLSRDYGKKIDDYILIDAPLNQTDLSYMVGSSREAVNRALKELEDKNIIFFVGHKIAITNRDKLLDEML